MQGLTLGKVLKNYDKEHPGKLLVAFSFCEDDGSQSQWIPLLSPYAGDGFGGYWLPETGSAVLVGFVENDLSQPLVLGCLWDEKHKHPAGAVTEKNEVKTLQTRGGHSLTFDDKENGCITLKTKKGFQIILSEDSESVTVRDSKGENKIVLDEKAKTVTVTGKNDITLKSGSAITLDSKTVTVKGKNIGIKSDGELSLEGKTVKLKGTNVQMEGTSFAIKGPTVKVESSGVLTLKGSMTKIN